MSRGASIAEQLSSKTSTKVMASGHCVRQSREVVFPTAFCLPQKVVLGESEASLVYRTSSRTARLVMHRNPVSRGEKGRNKKRKER